MAVSSTLLTKALGVAHFTKELFVLPQAPIETLGISFVPESHDDVFLGSVIAPVPIEGDLQIQLKKSYAPPGEACAIGILNVAAQRLQSAEIKSTQLAIESFLALIGHARCEARLLPIDLTFSNAATIFPLLPVVLRYDIQRSCVHISVEVPADASPGEQVVVLERIAVNNKCLDHGMPLRAVVRKGGMLAPLVIPSVFKDTSFVGHVISEAGILYAPAVGDTDVQSFGPDGTFLPPLPVELLGLSISTRAAAFDETTQTLFLADCDGSSTGTVVVAVDIASRTTRWRTAPGVVPGPTNLGVLTEARVLIVASYLEDTVYAYNIDDGARLDAVKLGGAGFLATHPTAPEIYVSTIASVTRLFWNSARNKFVPNKRVVEWPGASHMPLAISPPLNGTNYLIVASSRQPLLRVYSLPDFKLVLSHELVGIQVIGLAMDPTGAVLEVVCSRSSSAHIMAWPLPGMPQDDA